MVMGVVSMLVCRIVVQLLLLLLLLRLMLLVLHLRHLNHPVRHLLPTLPFGQVQRGLRIPVHAGGRGAGNDMTAGRGVDHVTDQRDGRRGQGLSD